MEILLIVLFMLFGLAGLIWWVVRPTLDYDSDKHKGEDETKDDSI